MVMGSQIQKTFFIRVNQSTGSGFALYDNKGDEYLITAKHVVDILGNKGDIQIFHENTWKDLSIKVFRHSNNEIDIALLKAEVRIIPNPLPIVYSLGDINIGQDTYFLGFPYGIFSNIGNTINSNFPIPFVKKGTCSLINHENEVTKLYLDGHNNPGFSGGPVCFKNEQTNKFHIGAVVSAYRLNNPQPTRNKDGQETDLYYMENSGIVISYDIKHAFEILNSINRK